MFNECLERIHIVKYLKNDPSHKLSMFVLKLSTSFLISLLSLTITKSGVYGVLIVVGVATIFFTVKFTVIDGIFNINIVYMKSSSDSG